MSRPSLLAAAGGQKYVLVAAANGREGEALRVQRDAFELVQFVLLDFLDDLRLDLPAPTIMPHRQVHVDPPEPVLPPRVIWNGEVGILHADPQVVVDILAMRFSVKIEPCGEELVCEAPQVTIAASLA